MRRIDVIFMLLLTFGLLLFAPDSDFVGGIWVGSFGTVLVMSLFDALAHGLGADE